MLLVLSAGLCPAGFDPLGLEENTNRRTIRLETGNLGGINLGRLSFHFAGSEVWLNANANELSSDKCTTALSGLKSAVGVTCLQETSDAVSGVGSYLITLGGYPQKPFMNNLITHNGNPAKNLFSCNVSQVSVNLISTLCIMFCVLCYVHYLFFCLSILFLLRRACGVVGNTNRF